MLQGLRAAAKHGYAWLGVSLGRRGSRMSNGIACSDACRQFRCGASISADLVADGRSSSQNSRISFTLRASAPLKLSSTCPLLVICSDSPAYYQFATSSSTKCPAARSMGRLRTIEGHAASRSCSRSSRSGLRRHSSNLDVLISCTASSQSPSTRRKSLSALSHSLTSGAVGVALGMCCSASTRLQCT